MSDASRAILNHLLFHKSLISEEEGGERINRYLSMLSEIDQGLHVAVRDPFEKSVVAAFELVLEKQLDPWEIDLMQFTTLFLDKVRKDGTVNFVTAGKLVFLAWSILKLQSDKVLLAAQPPEAEAPSDGWDLDLYRDPEDVDYNHLILDGAKMPLNEAIRRFAPNFHQKVHGEDLTEDIGLTWGRLTQFNGDPVPLRSLVAGSVWDEVTVFMALLFLAQLQKVKLWQKEFPHGEIFVKRLSTEETIAA